MAVLTQDRRRILVEALALQDVLWAPYRAPQVSPEALAAISERRGQFVKRGIPFTTSGEGEASRQAFSRAIKANVREGHLTASGQSRKRVVKLTSKGDYVARCLVGIPTIDQSWWFVELLENTTAIVKLLTAQDDYRHGSPHREWGNNFYSQWRMILEYWMLPGGTASDCEPNTPENVALLELYQETVVPLAAALIVDVESDTVGRLGYRFTPRCDGAELVAAGPPKLPITKRSTPRVDPELATWYRQAIADGFDERKSWRPEHPGHVYVGVLPAGLWPKLPPNPDPKPTRRRPPRATKKAPKKKPAPKRRPKPTKRKRKGK